MKELFDAIRAGEADRVRRLIEANSSLVNAQDENGVSAVATAKYNGRAEIASILVEHGATLDVFLAAMMGNTGRVKMLVSADPSLTAAHSADGWTALHLASFFGQAETATVLLDGGADVNARSTNTMANQPLHAAVAGRANEVARVLLARGAEVNARQHGGWTPLQGAAQSGNAELARILIAAGADVSARAENQQRALDLALTGGHQEMVKLLEESGASL
jgi:ankyrin repeat protein